MEILWPEDCHTHVTGGSRCVCKVLCMSESAPSTEKGSQQEKDLCVHWVAHEVLALHKQLHQEKSYTALHFMIRVANNSASTIWCGLGESDGRVRGQNLFAFWWNQR